MTVTFLDLIHALLVPTNFSKILPWLLQRSQKCSTHSSTLQRSKKCCTHYSTFYNRFCKSQRNAALILLHSTTVIAKVKEMLHSLFYILQQLLQRSMKCCTHYSTFYNSYCKDERNAALILLHSTTVIAKMKEMLHTLFYILQQLLQRSKKCYSHYNSTIYHATSQRVMRSELHFPSCTMSFVHL